MSCFASLLFFFFNDAATTDIYTLSLHDALPISFSRRLHARIRKTRYMHKMRCLLINRRSLLLALISKHLILDRKSGSAGMPRPISYAVFCLKKKKNKKLTHDTKTRPHVDRSDRKLYSHSV